MFQAIITKYLGPTYSKGGRVKATAAAGSVTLHWDHGLSATDNHEAAAAALCKKKNWSGRLVGGGLPDSTGYAFVFVDRG